MSLLGIDVGTSGCKSAVFSESGDLISLAYEEYDFQHPQPSWAELDTPAVWAQVKRTIGRAAAGARHDPPRGVCISSMGEAVVPVTREREILGASLLNFDTRGDEYLPALGRNLTNERLYQVNGNTLGRPYSLTKLKWIKANQPELYRQADLFLHWSGFVAFMLGAEPHVDYSLANRTLLFDLTQEDWSDELLTWAGLDREKLPPTLPSAGVVGRVSASSAAELGLPAGIPIISGGHDQCCNAVGCGVIEPGLAMYGMGSYLCMVPVFDRRPEGRAMMTLGLNTEHHAAEGQFVSFLYNQGGVLVKWFRDTFARAEHEQALRRGESPYPALFAEMPEAPAQILVLPHFTITGPPRFISNSSGAISGLRLGTSRGEILKGIIESATFYLYELFERLPGAGITINELIAAGGGSQSDAWVQLSADILGRPFRRLQVHEAGALGACILAGTGAGVFSSLREGVEAMVRLEGYFEPNQEKQKLYAEKFIQYRAFAKVMEINRAGLMNDDKK